MAMDLKKKQKDALVRMLHLNQATSNVHGDGDVYKVLVIDRYCRDVITPLLRVNELRKYGVTLHLMIDAERESIADTPAVYFVKPTHENVMRIVKDAKDDLYDTMHVNFAGALPEALMDLLADEAVKAGCSHKFTKIFDQYANFVSLEHRMFSLAEENSFVALNDPGANPEPLVEDMVGGITSILVTLGIVPYIKAPRGGAAEHIGRVLDERLRTMLKSKGNPLSDATRVIQRPLLCFFDRNFELAAAVQHAWAYAPLVHDVLGLKLNRVMFFQESDKPAAGQKKSYEVDSDIDFFWRENIGSPFPKVAEEVEVQLKRYKDALEEVNKKMSEEVDVDGGNTEHLTSAISSVPELTENKRMIDKHTNIATALLGKIKSRTLDQFHSMEEEFITNKVSKDKLLEMISPAAKGTAEDKLRLAIVYVLASETNPTPADYESIEGALRTCGSDIGPLSYVRKMRSHNLTSGGALNSVSSQGNFLEWADKIYGQGISAVTKGVKNLLAGERHFAITRAVEALSEGKQGTGTENFLVLDPKAPKGSSSSDRVMGPFKDIIVFMIGGGNYLEYISLQAFANQCSPKKNIVYGATEVVSGTDFLDQLRQLGSKTQG